MSPVCKPYTKKMTKRKMPPSQAAQIGENSEKGLERSVKIQRH